MAKGTSKKVATIASKTLKDPKASKEDKSLAASALANVEDKPKRKKKVETPEIEVLSVPTTGYFRVNGEIIEATANGFFIKHWKADNVHCTEVVDEMGDGEPMTREEIFAELF